MVTQQPSLTERAHEAAPAERPDQHVVVLSGLSGAGKTAATKLFEDLGYTCVDNLPGELLPELADLVAGDAERFAKVAIVLDVRQIDANVAFGAMRGALEGRGIRPQVFFLEARDEVIIRRFSETRHRHPLDDQRGIASSIAEERRLLEPVRAQADVIIDTSDLSLRELRERIFTNLSEQPAPDQLAIQLISFGFKFGVPLEADLVFDVRFMQNPYYVERLRQLSGRTDAVREYVLAQPPAKKFLDVRRRVPRLRDPGLRRRGQDAADDRDRLHRRLSPFDRDRGGAGHVARGALVRSPCRACPPPSLSAAAEPAPLADPGHRDQALARDRVHRGAGRGPDGRVRVPPARRRRQTPAIRCRPRSGS